MEFNGQVAQLLLLRRWPLTVGKDASRSSKLLRDWNHSCRSIAKCSELGTLRDVKVKLFVPEDVPAKFFKPRPVPYAIRGAIERDLKRLEQLGVIKKTNYSNWAAPIVAVPKPDGTVCICGDYKVTLNPVLQVKADDLFATLEGCQKFSKLDLSQAYQQVPLGKKSQEYVTINTQGASTNTIGYLLGLPLRPPYSNN